MSQCFVPTTVVPGGDCSEPGTVCGMGTYCSSTELTCVMENQLNDPCSLPYYPCAAGLQCNGVGPFATCGTAEGVGSACEADTDCNSGLCDKATDQAGGNVLGHHHADLARQHVRGLPVVGAVVGAALRRLGGLRLDRHAPLLTHPRVVEPG